ncbi:uncharacterized protein LOC134459546 [Engraulis encrasicolus]|uniref:uncharacterized protein LOC134459546 n=1 Tax=Engraulis encrasicolus TaxID=184585 RepID=UPI002FD2FD70
MSLCTQVILLLLPSVIFASHFLGGSVTFSYNAVFPNGSYKVMEMENSGDWVSLQNGIISWSLLTVVDLGNRSDTNKPNSSPVTTSISFVRVPQNCPRTYTMITFDPDSDQGRCRYGVSGNDECVGCAIPSGFALGQTTINQKDFCTLSYTSASAGFYGLEIVVEDFPQQTITLSYKNGGSSSRGPYSPGASPLSRIPLHFVVKVEAAVSSCEEGVYLPKFIAPTPANGETIPAVINQECEIIVNATASASSIHALLISGPLNITVNNYGGSSTQFALRWTPRTEDLGGYFPVCFVAETSTTFYQSDMRCVLLEVGDGTDPQPTALDASADIVVGMRMVVESTVDLTDESQSEIFIRQFQEELIKRGLPNSTTVRLRKVYQRDP